MIGSAEVAEGGTACDGKLSWGKRDALMMGSAEVAEGGTACDGKLSWGKREANCVYLRFLINCCADPKG